MGREDPIEFYNLEYWEGSINIMVYLVGRIIKIIKLYFWKTLINEYEK